MLRIALLFVMCVGAPPAALRGPPGLVAGVALLALGAWLGLGPRPFPGLLPGLLGVTVVLWSLAWMVVGVTRLAAE